LRPLAQVASWTFSMDKHIVIFIIVAPIIPIIVMHPCCKAL